MYCLANICCLCLNNNNIIGGIHENNGETATYFEKIISAFQHLSFGEDSKDFKLCSKCCDLINIVYDFENKCATSLNILKKYKTHLCSVNSNQNELFVNLSNTNEAHSFEIDKIDIFDPDIIVDGNPENNLEVVKKEIANTKIKYEENATNGCSHLTNENVYHNEVSSTSYREQHNKLNGDVDSKPHGLNLTIPQQKNITSEKEKTYECDLCRKKYISLSWLTKHKKSHKEVYKHVPNTQVETNLAHTADESTITSSTNLELDKPFQCEICSRKFNQYSTLIMHRNIHKSTIKTELDNFQNENKDKIIFECNVCFKKFNHRNNLYGHVKTHATEELYKCEICLKKFVVYSQLIRHRKIHFLR